MIKAVLKGFATRVITKNNKDALCNTEITSRVVIPTINTQLIDS